MKRLALSLTLLVPAAFGADSAPDLQRKFVGSWKLISIEGPNQTRNGKPFGMIMYDSTGHMSVHIVRGDRPPFPDGRAKATDKEKAVAFDTYTAYYGTYTFDPENRIVIHHLEGSLSPGQIGQDNILLRTTRQPPDSQCRQRRQGRSVRAQGYHYSWERIPAK